MLRPRPGSRPEDLFAAVLAARPESPLVGWYDDAASPPARMELSARSLATWAAKTVGLLADELGLGPGARVAVELPAHWVAVGVLAGVWAAGAEVVTGAADGLSGDTDVAVLTTDALAAHGRPDADEVYLVDPGSAWQLGGSGALTALGELAGADPTVHDLALALRPHADRFPAAGFPGAAGDPALDGLTRTDTVARALERAAALGLTGDTPARVAWTGALGTTADVLDAVLAPWAAGGSLVLAAGVAPARLAAVAAAEQTTAVLPRPS